jgi:hypothetical protein
VVTGGAASPEETAAIASALQRFLAENAPSPVTEESSRWQRAALLEGVRSTPGGEAWGANPR